MYRKACTVGKVNISLSYFMLRHRSFFFFRSCCRLFVGIIISYCRRINVNRCLKTTWYDTMRCRLLTEKYRNISLVSFRYLHLQDVCWKILMTLELLLYFLSWGFFETSFSDYYLTSYREILAENLTFLSRDTSVIRSYFELSKHTSSVIATTP